MLPSRLSCIVIKIVIERADPACSSRHTTESTRGSTVNTKTTQTGGLSVEQKYRRSLRWNLVLGLIAAFLAIVVAAEMLPGESPASTRSEEHTSELQSRGHIVCRLLL